MGFTYKNNQGRKYKVILNYPRVTYLGKRRRVNGSCDDPEEKKPNIQIDKSLRPKEQLATIIEEVTHSFYFHLKEKEVKPFAKTLARLLIRQGWTKL